MLQYWTKEDFNNRHYHIEYCIAEFSLFFFWPIFRKRLPFYSIMFILEDLDWVTHLQRGILHKLAHITWHNACINTMGIVTKGTLSISWSRQFVRGFMLFYFNENGMDFIILRPCLMLHGLNCTGSSLYPNINSFPAICYCIFLECDHYTIFRQEAVISLFQDVPMTLNLFDYISQIGFSSVAF